MFSCSLAYKASRAPLEIHNITLVPVNYAALCDWAPHSLLFLQTPPLHASVKFWRFLNHIQNKSTYSYHKAFDISLETSSGSSPFLYSHFCPDMPPGGFTNNFVYFVVSSSSLPPFLLIFLLFFCCSEADSCCIALPGWELTLWVPGWL